MASESKQVRPLIRGQTFQAGTPVGPETTVLGTTFKDGIAQSGKHLNVVVGQNKDVLWALKPHLDHVPDKRHSGRIPDDTGIPVRFI